MTGREIDALETFGGTSCVSSCERGMCSLVPLAFVGPRLAREKNK
jgi:hypothetical protein